MGVSLVRGASLPIQGEIDLDRTVLAFTFLVSCFTAVLFGLAPAWQMARISLNEVLKEGSRSATEGRARYRFRSSLVVAEVALSLSLLVGFGLMARSFLHALDNELGFDPEGVLTMTVCLPESQYPEPENGNRFLDQVMERVRGLPGVRSTAATFVLPMSGRRVWTVRIEGQPRPAADMEGPQVGQFSITPDYFEVMRIPLLKGRYFDRTDHDDVPGVAVINQRMAEIFWPNQDPIGKRFTRHPRSDPPDWVQVVGVVGNVRHDGLEGEFTPDAYYPMAQSFERRLVLLIRAGTDPASLTDAVLAEVQAVDANLPVSDIQTMEDIFWQRAGQRRLQTLLLGVFACLGLLSALIGIYGVISFSANQRRHEIGLRIALGAQPADAVRLILAQGFRLVATGVAIGIPAALVLMQLARSMLFGVGFADPATYVGVSLLLVLVALLAAYIPARRAARVDPIATLRYE